MKIALYQNNPAFGKIKDNVDSVITALKDKTFDILVLPELFATGYLFEDKQEALKLADIPSQGYVFDTLKQLGQAHDSLIIYGFPEKSGERVFNSAMALWPDGTFKIYQKTHLFNTEKKIFEPGKTGFSVFEYKKARIGLMICFDWRFPESARKLALLGAQIICHPSNLVMPHCPSAMVIRALENGVFTATCDRVGDENRAGQSLHFIGRSRVISPDGTILGELSEFQPEYLEVEIDPSLADNKAVTPLNDLFGDRRPEYY